MITFQYTEVVGWEAAIRGMRNPLESWEKSDSCTQGYYYCHECCGECDETSGLKLGPNDLGLMKRLRNAGTDHRKFMRMIVVYVDILAPLYWWKEFDTYRAGVKYLDDPNPFDIEMNSCSTMHTIHKKEFTLNDFSHEHLMDCLDGDYEAYNSGPGVVLRNTIAMLNMCRNLYLQTKDKKYWWQMIQLLPTSYNQKRTVMLNYEVLANIYKSRKVHKLDEWREFCDWIEGLPYSELIVGESSEKSDTSVETQEKHSIPSQEEINDLFKKVMRIDGRVRLYRVYNKSGVMVLDFYDRDQKTLYAFDLYRVTLSDALAYIKREIVKLTQQNLELGA